MSDESDELERDRRKELDAEYLRLIRSRTKRFKYLVMFIAASILVGVFFVAIPVGEVIFVFKSSPLGYLSFHGWRGGVEFLIKSGADVNAKEISLGNAPLHQAASRGHKDIVILLLQNGADVNVSNKVKETPLHKAVCAGSIDIMKILLEHGANPNQLGKDDMASLHLASHHRERPEALSMLIEYGADVNTMGDDKRQPLHVASANQNKEAALVLLENGADINAKDKEGFTPLHETIFAGVPWGEKWKSVVANQESYEGRQEFISFLVGRGAEVNSRNNKGETPLHILVTYMSEKLLVLFLKLGADVNAKDNQGQTPLHMAVLFSRSDLVPHLVKHGAWINKPDEQGRTPLSIAQDMVKKKPSNEVQSILEFFLNNQESSQ